MTDHRRSNEGEALASNRAAIRHVVESHRARNARVLGSVLRGQDTDSSDLDILIDPTPETSMMAFQPEVNGQKAGTVKALLMADNADDLRAAQWVIAHGSTKRGGGNE
jgi:predicted nucleotidyltransferase